jgi:hypothetical protein
MIPAASSSAWAAIAILGNHLWQSTLFAAAAWLLTLALRRHRAQVRYWLWLAASVKFLVPFALLVRRVISTLLLMTFSAPAHSRQNPQGGATFRSGTRLIVQAVGVKNKDGRPIEGLTAKDFTLTEDGEPQTISFVEFERLSDSQDEARPAPASSSPAPDAARIAPTTGSGISIPAPGDRRYRNRRLLVLYFDVTAMPPSTRCALTRPRGSSSTHRCEERICWPS